jgi:carboxypeptidase T
MKYFSLTILSVIISCLFFNINSFSQEKQEKYSKVKIYATSRYDFDRISQSGLNFDGGIYKPGLFFETWLSESEIDILKTSGVPFNITITDWLEYYNSIPKMTSQQIQEQMKQSADDYNVTHSIYGTMGGHLTYSQAVNKLDSMRMEYPNFISAKFSIGNSVENRAMWTIRVTKNPDAPTGRPEIWLNGVTHAREPMGMMNVFYYLYWLLENYNIDPIATYILNNREIYFTPIINPDGYAYNESTNPTGGGMWRKNRHNFSGTYGVDLNRNFGTYNFWNSTNAGSSTTVSSDTYRGPSPFSEPETQNFKTFFNSRNFKCNLDYHTYGNYLIKPYAWCDPTPTPDDAVFNEYGNDIVAVNHFTFGTPYQTVGYYVRGGDIDWCYSTDTTGHTNHVFGMTPEVGVIGFYSNAANIIPEAITCLEMNKYYSLVAGAYTGPKSTVFNKQSYVQNETGNFKVVFRNKGRADAQNIKVEFKPVTSYFTIPVQVYSRATLPVFVSDSTTFNFTINSNCPNNTSLIVKLRIKQNDSIIVYEKDFPIFVGTGYTVLADSAENGISNWPTMTNWAVVTNKYLSPTHSFKGSCISSTVSQMVSIPVNVSSYPAVYLSFYQKYALESGYDYGFVDVSSNNGTTWQRIATFNGIDSSTWKFQSFNISSNVGGSTNMLVRFRDSTDASLNYDGWYVDNIRITGYQVSPPVGVNTSTEEGLSYDLMQNYPNPFNPNTKINFTIPKQNFVKLNVYDISGKLVSILVNESKDAGKYEVIFNGENLSSGIYFYKIEAGDFIVTRKMILIK